MKKKIVIILIMIIMVGGAFILGRQVGLNTEDSNTKTVVTEETVSKHDIQNTLTGSGQISSKTTEEIELSTSKYFEALCVEEDDTVNEGENLIKYTDGTYLTAPYNCVVISYSVPDTEEKCMSSNYIKLSNLNDLTTSISINENEINNVAVDQEVEITLTADTSKTYTGKVTKIDSVGTYASSGTTFTALVEFENDGDIKLGMSVSCTIILKEEKDAISIPIEAVYENANGEKYVNKIKNDGTTEEIIIETGIADDSYVQVISGLNVDEKVQVITETTESTKSDDDSSNSRFGGNGGFGMDMDSKGDQKGGDFQSGFDFESMTPPSGGSMPSMPGGSN